MPPLVGPPRVRNSACMAASPKDLRLIRLPDRGRTSITPVESRFHRDGPSSFSRLFSVIFAHASMLVPSKRTIEPEGGLAPNVGGVRETCCKSNISSPLLALKWPPSMTPVHPSPLKVTTLFDSS